MSNDFKVGSEVIFAGFTEGEDAPENGQLLTVGETYAVGAVREGGPEDETVYSLDAPNPDFDPQTRASKKKNPKTVPVEVFPNEITAAGVAESDEEAEEGEEAVEPVYEEDAAEDAAEFDASLAYADMSKGDEVSAYDEGGNLTASGTITRKTKRGITVRNSGTGEEVTVFPDTSTFYAGLYEEEPDGMSEVPPEDDPDLKDMIILDEGEEDAEIISLVNETEDLCGLAHEMSEESASIDYKLGGVLYHVRLSKAYKNLDEEYAGKKGFQLYVEKELPVGYRKAMYLIDIYAKWNKFGLPPEKVQEIGWTKAQAIAGAMTDDNAEDLVAMAEENTVADIKETIKETYVGGGAATERVKRIKFTFKLYEDSAVTVREYLEQAMSQLGMDNEDQLFEQIVTEWATEHLSIKKATAKGSSAKKASTKKASTKKASTKKAVAKKVSKKQQPVSA